MIDKWISLALIGILTRFFIENYRLKVNITLTISVNIDDFHCVIFSVQTAVLIPKGHIVSAFILNNTYMAILEYYA